MLTNTVNMRFAALWKMWISRTLILRKSKSGAKKGAFSKTVIFYVNRIIHIRIFPGPMQLNVTIHSRIAHLLRDYGPQLMA